MCSPLRAITAGLLQCGGLIRGRLYLNPVYLGARLKGYPVKFNRA